MPADAASGPVTRTGLNHLVINVRDLEQSHRFRTGIRGFKQVGEYPVLCTEQHEPA